MKEQNFATREYEFQRTWQHSQLMSHKKWYNDQERNIAHKKFITYKDPLRYVYRNIQPMN